jgi:SARP family transcriptional regulator, regulator of embCAB operon
MARASRARIQLCGRLVVELDGRRVEAALPGAKGQLLFAYLVLNRHRRQGREELLVAVYGEEATPGHRPRLSVLLSKLRRVVGPELVAGRSEIELVLPPAQAHLSADHPDLVGKVSREDILAQAPS